MSPLEVVIRGHVELALIEMGLAILALTVAVIGVLIYAHFSGRT